MPVSIRIGPVIWSPPGFQANLQFIYPVSILFRTVETAGPTPLLEGIGDKPYKVNIYGMKTIPLIWKACN
jgi:hypothetical protein